VGGNTPPTGDKDLSVMGGKSGRGKLEWAWQTFMGVANFFLWAWQTFFGVDRY